MALFGKKKTIDDMTTEEIEKYLESRKSGEKSEQTEKDRVDESVAMQEKDSGETDSQTAKDRVDEAIGEDKALSERREDKEEAQAEERGGHPDAEEDRRQFDELISPLKKELEELRAEVAAMKREPRPADNDAVEKLRRLENRFSN